MSRYFWNTIIFFIVVSLVLLIVIFIKQNEQQNSEDLQKTPITSNFVEVLSDKMKQNLEKNAPKILENLEITKEDINFTINSSIDKLFDEIIDKNLDRYLDFHYSVKGEYTQLWIMAFGDMNKPINEKLLGDDFGENLDELSKNIVENSYKKIENHLNFTTNIATQNVDLKLNQSSLEELSQNIEKNLKHNLIDMKATVVGTIIATKLAISIATKVSAKAIAKTTAKMTAKLAASGTAATSGALCGVAALPCGIVAGVLTWFGTDAIIISGDEYLNRDDFKQEIINSLNEAKEELKLEYKPILEQVDKISIDYQNELKNTQTKKRVIENLK